MTAKRKRPRDASQLAKTMVDIVTGEVKDVDPDDCKNKAAQELGRKGGKARAKKLSPERRREVAKIAAQKRWKG